MGLYVLEGVLEGILVLLCLAGVYIFIALMVWMLTGNDFMLSGVDRWIERSMDRDEDDK